MKYQIQEECVKILFNFVLQQILNIHRKISRVIIKNIKLNLKNPKHVATLKMKIKTKNNKNIKKNLNPKTRRTIEKGLIESKGS